MKISHKQASARIQKMLANGRLIPNAFQSKDERGRRLACLIGSISPKITKMSDCPANLMPQWMLEATIMLFDRMPGRLQWAARYAHSMAEWGIFKPEDWEIIRRHHQFKIMYWSHHAMMNLPPLMRADYEAVVGEHLWNVLKDGHIGFTFANITNKIPRIDYLKSGNQKVNQFTNLLQSIFHFDVCTMMRKFYSFASDHDFRCPSPYALCSDFIMEAIDERIVDLKAQELGKKK